MVELGDMFNVDIGGIAGGVAGGLAIAIVISLVFVVVIYIANYFSYNIRGIVLKPDRRFKQVMLKKVKNKEAGCDILMVRGNFLQVLLNNGPKVPIKSLNFSDYVLLKEVGIDNYQQIDVDLASEDVKFIDFASDIEKELFIKETRILANRFKAPEERFSKLVSMGIVLILAIAVIIIFDGLNKTQKEIASMNANTVSQTNALIKEALNGTYIAQYCQNLYSSQQIYPNKPVK